MSRFRLAYLVTHPIQYQAPLLKLVAADPDIDLTVFFCSDISVGQFWDSGFQRHVKWDIPLLDGYQYHFLPALGGRGHPSFWRPINYGFAKRLGGGRFHALWVHGYARAYHLAAITEARIMGLKVLIRDEANGISAARGPLKRLAKRGFFLGLRQLCDAYLAIGSLNRDYYREHGVPEERIFLVPYAVDNCRFQALAAAARRKREVLRSNLGLDSDRAVILFASKLIRRKRPQDLLDAYALLARDASVRFPYLLFVGDGDMRSALERRVSSLGLESVAFLGFKGQSELPAYYDLADVFVLPSFNEPWGLVVNEAMNARCSIVVSDQVGAGPDLVRHGENGFVFRAGNVGELAQALRQTLINSARCRNMGLRSLDIISGWGLREDIEGLKAALTAG